MRTALAVGTTLVGALLCGNASPAVGQVAGAISESQQRLESIRRDQEELRSEMQRVRSRVTDISTQLSTLDRQVTTAAGLLSELQFQLRQRERQIEMNTRELLATRDQLAERRAVLHRRVRDIYKRGPLHSLEVLLGARSFSDLLTRYKYLFLVARHDRRLAAEVTELEQQLIARERALRNSVEQIERLRAELALERDDLAALQAQQRTALEGARTRESVAAGRFGDLQRDAERIGDLLATVERQEAAESASPSGAGGPVPLDSIRRTVALTLGTLPWPVQGSVAYGFGLARLDDGTSVRRSGLGIGARRGEPVRAVASGEVVHAGNFGSYGTTVILSHGNGYFTLYLYLEDLGVRQGDWVERGRTVGTVGGGDPIGGSHIEFQLRIPGGEAVDPLPWLVSE